MWMTVMIAGGLFAAMVAILWVNFEEAEKRRAREGAAEGAEAAPIEADPGHCGLCAAPLPQRRTSDEVVDEVEHRIDADLEEIEHALRSRMDRLYVA